MSEAEEAVDVGSEMSLLSHLNELRIRLSWTIAGLLVATIISFIFADEVLGLLVTYYHRFVPDGQLQLIRPTESIETFFKVALLIGGAISMPNTLLQIWFFISPGLTKRERKYVYIFVPSALLLFGLGIVFSIVVLLPTAINFLATFLEGFEAQWTAPEFLSFLITMIFWLGVSFELPIIIYFIARVGVVPASTLREQWRIAIVAISVIAAAVTPSIDPITMLLTMLPLTILYGLSIVLAHVGQRQFERAMAV
jgi:sec-independent protein translocase protein TatC